METKMVDAGLDEEGQRKAASYLHSLAHPLARWLRDVGMSQKQFASEIGYSVTWVNGVLRGRTRPSYEALLKIEEFTRGIVGPSDVVWFTVNHSRRGA